MTDQPTPETDAKLADDPQPSSDSPDYARALEIHIHLLRAELADERAKTSDALLRLHVTTAKHDEACTERDEARNALTDNLWSEWETERAATLGRLTGAQQTVARLRAALDEYGEHQGVCPKKYHGMKDSRPCTCGLAEALATPAQ